MGLSRVVWQVLAVILVVVLVGASLLWLISKYPSLACNSALSQLATCLSVAQLDLAIISLGLGVGLGVYAIEQVYLARFAIDQESQARKDARRAEMLRILGPLYTELDRNRIVAFGREWRLVEKWRIPNYFRLPFERRVYDAMLAGPVWSTSEARDIWAVVEDAYVAMARLDRKMLPTLNEWGYSTVGIGIVAWSSMKFETSIGWYLLGGSIALYVWAVEVVLRSLGVVRRGQATETRLKIEKAMETIHSIVTGKPLDWSELDRARSDSIKVLPPWQLRRLIGRIWRVRDV